MAETLIEWTDKIIIEFWAFVKRGDPDECWPWIGSRNTKGYGGFRRQRRLFMANRLSLELKLGRPLREGMCACHACDNPPCCNPDHLFEGTQADNLRDCRRKGRHAYKLSASQVHELRLVFPLKRGKRGWLTRLAERYGVSKQQISNIVYRRQHCGD
jgi:hypothetical protein